MVPAPGARDGVVSGRARGHDRAGDEVPVRLLHDVAAEAGRAPSCAGRHRRPAPRGGAVRLPTALSVAAWQPGRLAVLGVLLVTVAAVLVLGLRVAWASSGDHGDVVAPGGGARAGPVGLSAGAAPAGVPAGADVVGEGGEGSGGDAAAGGPPTDGAPDGTAPDGSVPEQTTAGGTGLVVHVVGQVAEPGVLRLPAGSRVSDAVEAAGGATRRADLAALNLARPLVDGEQVRVPAPGEEPPAAAPPSGDGGAAAGTPGAASALVPLNTADVTALDGLPGIGPVLAQRIVDWRTVNGRFSTVDELAEVSGIGEKLLAQLRPLVTT
ncbi:helix-hairpin-helix domain-containing protein [Phycicoccus sp. BSK3Z-2]|uniref:Helix-hairpin-helix domain-containing protein n=2 Tax=Phycicoccus avicenniae TaxID=2828860 RepID=A0A941DBD7_9MICO|nr:helix-hairpin-helix domain-containing protein [Phycicoccus avicenniae]